MNQAQDEDRGSSSSWSDIQGAEITWVSAFPVRPYIQFNEWEELGEMQDSSKGAIFSRPENRRLWKFWWDGEGESEGEGRGGRKALLPVNTHQMGLDFAKRY